MTKTITAKVLLDRILVRPVSKVEQNVGGIIVLANSAGNSAFMAEVVSCGDALRANACANHANEARLKVGDTVLLEVSPLGVKAGVEVSVSGESLRVVREADILVVL